MKIKDICIYAPKSNIKAGDAEADGQYIFFTSSEDENKRYREYQFDSEAIIMGTGGNATLHYCNGKFAVSTDCVVLLPNNQIRCKYLYYFFLANLSILEAGFKGAGLKHTNKGYIGNIEIKLPSLEEQDGVIRVLDQTFDVIRLRNQELSLLDDLVKSRFVEMFGDLKVNSKGWTFSPLSKVCDIRDGTHDSPKYVKNGYPLMTSKNFANGKVDFTGANLISENDFMAINKRSKVDVGDIVMPMIGTIGHPVIINTEKQFAIKNVALIKFTNSNISNIFVKAILDSDYFLNIVKSKNRGNTQKFIALNDIRNICVPNVPIVLQNEFSAFVTQVDQTKSVMQKVLDKAQLLFDSLMQKYFG